MNYSVEMELGAMIYLPDFIKNGRGIQKLIAGKTQILTHRKVIPQPSFIL
jgi:hypothetical protein